MRVIRNAVLVLACSIAASCASHQGAGKADAAAPKMPAPVLDGAVPRDEFLSHLAGDWALTRSFQGEDFHCEAEVRWVLGDRWVSLHEGPPGEPPKAGRLPYEAIVFIGFDADAQEYIAYWHDTFGAKYAGAGRGKRVGDVVEFRFDDASGVFFNTFTYDRAADTWACLLENGSKSGERKFFARETYRRK